MTDIKNILGIKQPKFMDVIMDSLNNLVKDNKGASAVEYALLVGAVVIAILIGARIFGIQTGTSLQLLAAKVATIMSGGMEEPVEEPILSPSPDMEPDVTAPVESAEITTSPPPTLTFNNNTKGSFPNGYCTKHAADKFGGGKSVPWSGDAGEWNENAEEAGFDTGSTPEAGAIMVKEGNTENQFGHVSYVESVDTQNGTFTVSEMNYGTYKGEGTDPTKGITNKFGVETPRTINTDDVGSDISFIYYQEYEFKDD